MAKRESQHAKLRNGLSKALLWTSEWPQQRDGSTVVFVSRACVENKTRQFLFLFLLVRI